MELGGREIPSWAVYAVGGVAILGVLMRGKGSQSGASNEELINEFNQRLQAQWDLFQQQLANITKVDNTPPVTPPPETKDGLHIVKDTPPWFLGGPGETYDPNYKGPGTYPLYTPPPVGGVTDGGDYTDFKGPPNPVDGGTPIIGEMGARPILSAGGGFSPAIMSGGAVDPAIMSGGIEEVLSIGEINPDLMFNPNIKQIYGPEAAWVKKARIIPALAD